MVNGYYSELNSHISADDLNRFILYLVPQKSIENGCEYEFYSGNSKIRQGGTGLFICSFV